jgi:hypothetical protein
MSHENTSERNVCNILSITAVKNAFGKPTRSRHTKASLDTSVLICKHGGRMLRPAAPASQFRFSG